MTTLCQTCRKCDLSIYSNKKIIYRTVGAPPYRYAFVARAPDETDYLSGIPVSGLDAAILNPMLEEAMGNRSYLITNSVFCVPFESADRAVITEPQKQSIEACRTNLHQLLALIKPRMVFTLGLHAYRTVNKIKGMEFSIVKLADPTAIRLSKQQALDKRKFVVTIKEYLNAEEESSS